MANLQDVIGPEIAVQDVKDFPITATLISFLPYELNSANNSKPGLLPSYFYVPPVYDDDFVVVPITDCKDYTYIGEGKSLSRWISGIQVAGSIVRDHILASISIKNDAFPGLKAIPGNHSKEFVKKNFDSELKDLLETQRRWFGELVRVADDIWSDPTARGKHRLISDLHRHACKYLKLNRDWMTSVVIDLVSCIYCRFNIPASATICMNCKMEQKPLTVPELKKAQA